MRVSIAGVTPAGCPQAGELDGDFILHAVERGPRRCRWELAFPARCGLFRTVVEAMPTCCGPVRLRAFLEGSVPGPQWRSEVRDLRKSLRLAYDHTAAANPAAGVRWPESVALSPLWGAVTSQAHYIPPEPTAAEARAMAEGGATGEGSCEVTGVNPATVTVCVGSDQQFSAQGMALDDVEWSTDPAGDPATGSGPTFTTKWDSPGAKTVTASCEGTSEQAEVTVVGVARIIVDGSDPENVGPLGLCPETEITVRAIPDPEDATFPTGEPRWTFLEQPSITFSLAHPQPGPTATFTPIDPGTYVLRAECGTSSATIQIEVGDSVRSNTIMVMHDPEVDNQQDFDVRVGGGGYPNLPAKIINRWRVSIRAGCTPPSTIEIMFEPLPYPTPTGQTPSFGGAVFRQIGPSGTWTAVGDVPTSPVQWRSGATLWFGGAASGCVVLDNGPPAIPQGDPSTAPEYDPDEHPLPPTPPDPRGPYYRINQHGRWFKVLYSITVEGGKPYISVNAAQQERVETAADRTCP